jgi:4-amino-4-deoxy-L-arabinose transferase-like glycosyltransferase
MASFREKATCKFTSDSSLFWLLFCTHFSLASFYDLVCGVKPNANITGLGIWDSYWQLLPSDIMRHHLLQGLWYLHAQPPLYNLLCGILFKLFFPHHLAFQQWLNSALGSLAAAMTYTICKEIFRNKPVAFATALFLALNPSLFLFEANALYDFLCLFLITLSGYCLVRYCKEQTNGALIGFCAGINSLILVRSLYHIVILVPLAIVVLYASVRNAKKAMVIFLLMGMVPFAWYAKNAVMFGFFGGSSWFGYNLFNQVSYNTPLGQLELAKCDAFVLDGVFPDTSNFRRYGFARTSTVPSLRNNDFHNINVVAISHAYLINSLRLIRTFPGKYAKNTVLSYFIFCKSSAQFFDVADFAARIPGPVTAWEWLEGRIDFPWRSRVTNFVIFLPLALVLAVLLLINEKLGAQGPWREVLRNNILLLYVMVMVSYTVIVSSMFEMGENNRFKFPVEQFIWILVLFSVFAVARLVRDSTRRTPQHR